MAAYYNEIEPFAAAWLRELMKAGHIMDGTVDERSIRDVQPADLRGFQRAHFFAGIGVWDYALTRAGWGDRPVWTGSCPCQPFSASGKGTGFSDDRHLWPDFYRLIRECRPDVVFGEQVADRGGPAWLDLVHADMEAEGYAVGALDLSAAGFGAPHRRQRFFWVADADGAEPRRDTGDGDRQEAALRRSRYSDGDGADASRTRSAARRLADADVPEQGRRQFGLHAEGRSGNGPAAVGEWANVEWLACADGKARPVEPGTFPLAHGAPARVGRLRGYGNAIVAPVAEAFIRAYIEVAEGR